MDSFIYFGHFYELTIDQEVHSCRSTLEIIRLGDRTAQAWAQEPSSLLDHQPDAVFVMLNPGSSRPCDGRQTISTVSDPRQIAQDASANLMLTCPDDTQRAIEIVMSSKQLTHARILNLLDIRNTNSKDIHAIIRSQSNGAPPYSVFSSQRQDELTERLRGTNQIVVIAWTVERKSATFFQECYQVLDSDDPPRRVFGWKHRYSAPSKRLFYHPSRNFNNWARNICKRWPDDEQSCVTSEG